jgi:hypothetical protein
MNPLSLVSRVNTLAKYAGLLGCQVQEAKYQNYNGNTVSLFILNKLPNKFGIDSPLFNNAESAIDAYKLVSSLINKNQTNQDPNQNLFGTFCAGIKVKEKLQRKFAINKVPYANYDQIIPMGTGGQQITLTVAYGGLNFQQGFLNTVQTLMMENNLNTPKGNNNLIKGLGILQHPFYGEIKNVLPIEVDNVYTSERANFVLADITFITTDSSHLIAGNNKKSKQEEIAYWYQATQRSILGIIGAVDILKTVTRGFIG